MDYNSVAKLDFKLVWPVSLSRKDKIQSVSCINGSGGRLNKKDGLTRYGDSHVKDKTS